MEAFTNDVGVVVSPAVEFVVKVADESVAPC
jgi:hypothetical protein